MVRDMRFEAARWSIFGIMILTYILVYFHRMAPGVVSEYLMADFQTTGTRLGSLSAIYFFVYAAMQLPSGVLADTLGTRTSIIGGNLIAGIGSILFGLAPSFEMACAGRFLVGLGVSVVFIAIMKNNAVWFHARVFGLMGGVTLFIGNLGSVTAAGPLSALLSLFAWRTIFLAIGLFSLLLAIAAFFIVKNRPEDLGFAPPNPRVPAENGPVTHASWLKNLWGVVTLPRVWPGFVVQFGIIGGLYSFMGLWAMPYLRDVHGLARSEAAGYMTAMLLSFAFGALFFGWFSDRIGRRKPVLIAGMLLYTCSWLLLLFTEWELGFDGKALFGLMGFAGASFVITFACAKEVINPELSGMAVSVVNTGCFVGTALMQPLFGWMADRTWDGSMQGAVRVYSAADYDNGFLLMLAFTILGLLGSFMVPETRCRNITVSEPSIA
ncbi:MFS transporter [Desulfopila aestuarii]|uniref:Sugar phosphate permease n=1 Tax=Desulfopila aestuarii DSM 18488 TaxID=1121416 RepID=A0A1M7Y2Z6_9BACT|nr:MFS transporter [Desulfopila aestuarii]SHO46358.1 Sugar phosphate permease [Desulfopila aestuarii DSM 18488]